MERIDELYQNNFLEAVSSLYSRYVNYEELLPIIDIALLAIIMGDFEKIKFPTKEGMDSIAYLSKEQKSLLLSATHQLDFMDERTRSAWISENVSIEKVAEESVDVMEQTMKSVKQKVEDLKYHFESHMHKRKGKTEKSFSFNQPYLSHIRECLRTLENNSTEFQKLKQIETIITSINELEKIDFSKAKENQAEIKKCLRNAASATKNLFTKYYGYNEESLQSLQAKMDIALLNQMILGEKEKLSIESLKAYESSDYLHLILAGKEPENSGSCQRYDGTPDLMVGLSGYLLNSTVKIIRVENQDGIVVGRSMLRIVESNKNPVLFLENAYYRGSISDPNVDGIIIELAKKKAESMSLPLVTTWIATKKRKKMTIVIPKGLSQYDYSDGLEEGVVKGKTRYSLKVSILA